MNVGLKTTEMPSLTTREARTPKSRCSLQRLGGRFWVLSAFDSPVPVGFPDLLAARPASASLGVHLDERGPSHVGTVILFQRRPHAQVSGDTAMTFGGRHTPPHSSVLGTHCLGRRGEGDELAGEGTAAAGAGQPPWGSCPVDKTTHLG